MGLCLSAGCAIVDRIYQGGDPAVLKALQQNLQVFLRVVREGEPGALRRRRAPSA